MWPKQKLLMLVWKYAKVIHCKYLKYRKYKKYLCSTYLFVILYFSITGVNGTLMIRLQKVVTTSRIVLHWTKTVLVAKVANQIVQKIVSIAVEELNSLSTMTCSKCTTKTWNTHSNNTQSFTLHSISKFVMYPYLQIRNWSSRIQIAYGRRSTFEKRRYSWVFRRHRSKVNEQWPKFAMWAFFNVSIWNTRSRRSCSLRNGNFRLNSTYYMLPIILLNTRPKKTTEHQLYVAEHKVMKNNSIIWPLIDATHCTTISLSLASLTEPDGTRLNPCWRLGLMRPP